MRIVLFEDDRVSQLFPLTLTRPAYTINCGSVTLLDWASQYGSCVTGHVRDYLQSWQLAECPVFCEQPTGSQTTCWINARMAPTAGNLFALTQLINKSDCGYAMVGDQLAAAILPPAADAIVQQETDKVSSVETIIHQLNLPKLPVQLQLFEYPHQIVEYHLQNIHDHLSRRIETGQLPEIRDGVFSASPLSDHVVTDSSAGPIVIEQNVTVRPLACLNGPIYLAANSRVNEHTMLKNGVVVGEYAKVGGEIGASIIEAYSNKCHYGYLGHSYLGCWVNLGAGTSNSNLKNSYGNVRVEVEGQSINTGMQFMGCVIGDYTKSAINTSIFTGKLIGACSMLYGCVTTNVPSFVNYARSFGQITEMNPAIVALTQKRAYDRRGIAQQPWQIELIHAAYERVSQDRQLADQPLAL